MKYIVALALILSIHNSFAQNFTHTGTIELGGSMAISYQSGNGDEELSLSTFSFSPYAGFMVFKGFELGFSPVISSYNINTYGTFTTFGLYLAPAYNFDIKSNVYPYIELLAGYSMVDHSSFTENAIGLGGHLGIKVMLGNAGLLIINAEYLRQSFTSSENDDDYFGNTRNRNIDALSLGVGFRVFFGQAEKKGKSEK